MTLKEKSVAKVVSKGLSSNATKFGSVKEKYRMTNGQSEKNFKTLRKIKKLKVGDVCLLKISALGPKGIGIDEYTYGYSIFVPNTNLGEQVKVKIVKLSGQSTSSSNEVSSNFISGNSNKRFIQQQFAIGQILEVVSKSTIKVNIKPEELLTVNIEKLGNSNQASSLGSGAGIVNLNDNYKLIIPNAKIGTNIKVIVTRVKSKYAFAKIKMEENTVTVSTDSAANNRNIISNTTLNHLNLSNSNTKLSLLEGSKFSLTLPKTGKYYGKYAIVKIQGSIIFIKLALNAKPGNKVRIKVIKINSKFAIAKVIQLNPTSLFKKRILVQNSICQMVKNGMHLGEKAVKCNARMKNYVWLKKRGQNKNRPLIKKGRHIINLLKTRRCLNKALTQLSKYALKGRTFMFIGTKKPAASLVARTSLFSKTSFFVNTRWLGGMLTNWKTILKSISKIRPILKEKQKIVADILAKRQAIKLRLIKKALLLKKKSKLILTKGRFLINQFKNSSFRENLLQKTKMLSLKRKQLVENCYSLLSRRQILITKRRELMYQSIILKEKGLQIISRYKTLLNQLTIYSKKLRELKYLAILSNEIKNIKNKARLENKDILNVSYGKVKELVKNSSINESSYNIIPNPPKEILNLILLTIIPSNNQQSSDFINIEGKQTSVVGQNKSLILSKLVSKFSRFAPYLKTLIKTYEENIKEIVNAIKLSTTMLSKIKITFKNYIQLKNSLVKELHLIKTKLTSERHIIRVVKTKLKHFAAQKRLIKFLPRLRYLATPLFTTKIMETVKILMKKIVDPKLKYPVDNIYDDKLSNNSKKVGAARKKKWQRLEKYFGGISSMTKMTKSQISKNIAIVIGQKEEMNAVRECQKLGIKMFNIVDTNCNPSLATHIIPANDDSRNSIKYILNQFLVRIRLSQKLRKKVSNTLKLTSVNNSTISERSRTNQGNFSKINRSKNRP
jgi:small subunit ribosomal protein S2